MFYTILSRVCNTFIFNDEDEISDKSTIAKDILKYIMHIILYKAFVVVKIEKMNIFLCLIYKYSMRNDQK